MKMNKMLLALSLMSVFGISACGSSDSGTAAENSNSEGSASNLDPSNQSFVDTSSAMESSDPSFVDPIPVEDSSNPSFVDSTPAVNPGDPSFVDPTPVVDPSEPSVVDSAIVEQPGDVVQSSSSVAVPKSSSSQTVRPKSSSSKVSQPSNVFVDSRDGSTYRITTIGSQIWMAENLRYETSSSWCYQSESDCAKYGRLYTWNDAVEICPSGWHLPSEGEWEILFSAVGGHNLAGILTAKEWSVDSDDPLEFSALPGGYYSKGTYNHVGDYATFWSSTDYSSYNGNYWRLTAGAVYLYNNPKSDGMSVRCLLD